MIEIYNQKCQYCEKIYSDSELCVDHIFPRGRGGMHAFENWTLACVQCNLKKSDLILGEGYLQILKAKAERMRDIFEKKVFERRGKAGEKWSVDGLEQVYFQCLCKQHCLAYRSSVKNTNMICLIIILSKFAYFLGTKSLSGMIINQNIMNDLKTHLQFRDFDLYEAFFDIYRIHLFGENHKAFPVEIERIFTKSADTPVILLSRCYALPPCFHNLPGFNEIVSASIRSLFPKWKDEMHSASQERLPEPIQRGIRF